jgi:hypothetical protein
VVAYHVLLAVRCFDMNPAKQLRQNIFPTKEKQGFPYLVVAGWHEKQYGNETESCNWVI